MSRSNPETHLTNPATRFFDWAGDTGTLEYYDREKKENIPVELPFRFLVLDIVYQVAGGYKNGRDYIGYFSNAIKPRDIKTAVITVKSKYNNQTRVEGQGTWAQLKTSLSGAKFVTGLYIAFYDQDGHLQIGYLKLKGAANSAWIEFNNSAGRKDICAGAYTLKSRSEELQNGNTTYFEPVFSWTDQVKDETESAAVALDEELQKYLIPYFTQQSDAEPRYSGIEREYGDDFDSEAQEERKAIQAAPVDTDSIPF